MVADRAAADVAVALTTASTTVAPGAEFDVGLVLPSASAAFNAFEAIVGHDPAALTLVPRSPLSLQEGSLLTAACGSRFHLFRSGLDRDTITCALLCNQVSVTGPGEIYRLRFRASTTPQTTTIAFLPGLRFFDAGISASGVQSSDLTIVIQGSVDVAERPVPAGLRMRLGPNPSRGEAQVWVDASRDGPWDLTIRDLAGRTVRRLQKGWGSVGGRMVRWDARDESGLPAPSGLYLVELRSGSEVERAKLFLAR